jgi:predicted ATPase/DNA-binding SARP family transcriptional activator
VSPAYRVHMLRYRVLGPLEVADDDQLIRIPSTQQRLLLGMLLADAGRTVSADRLIDELWADCLPSDPAAALRTQVSRLRRRLGAGANALVTEKRGYRLDVEADQVDARLFERLLADGRLGEALALRRGPPLVEFAEREFARAEAVRLEELCLAARERHAQTELARGKHDQVIADLQALITEHPEREHARQLLMEALYQTGRHADALAVYQRWRRELVERGLEPTPELSQLEQRILEHRVVPSDSALPAPTDSFVGRERDMAAVARALSKWRVVTLCGPGGVGKTRLALEAAAHVGDRYRDGVRFCDLSALRRPTDVDRAVAAAVGVRERAFRRVIDQIIADLSSRRLLLVLDNCEHLAGTVGRLVERIVQHTTGVDVLATSRERMGVGGEHLWSVEPLDATSAAGVFVDRARAAHPGFAADDDSVAEICARLDCLPLAIELAATSTRAMTTRALADALGDRFEVLTLGSRVTQRHSSLDAVVGWSYELLSSEERAVFDRFGAFAGPVDAEAAGAVCGAHPAVLVRLVDRSLLVARRGDVTQYSMLETIRVYARSRLEKNGALEATRDDHAAWAVEFAEQASAGLAGPEEDAWSERIATHLSELRAAHVWLVGRDTEAALRLSAALHPWAFWRGRSEVFRWAEVAAATAGSTRPPLLQEVVSSAAAGAWQRGDLVAAEAGARAAARHPRAREVLAEVAFLHGDLADARRLYLEAAAQSEAAGDALQAVWDRGSAALALHYDGTSTGKEPAGVLALAEACGSPSARAFAHFVIGEVESSEQDLRRAIELSDCARSEFVTGIAEVSLASVTARRRDPATALDHYDRAIRGWEQVGAWTPQWVTLRTLAHLLAQLDMTRDAAILYGVATTDRTGSPAYGSDAVMLRELAASLRSRLGNLEFNARVEEGAALADEDAVTAALDAVQRARGTAGSPLPG